MPTSPKPDGRGTQKGHPGGASPAVQTAWGSRCGYHRPETAMRPAGYDGADAGGRNEDPQSWHCAVNAAFGSYRLGGLIMENGEWKISV